MTGSQVVFVLAYIRRIVSEGERALPFFQIVLELADELAPVGVMEHTRSGSHTVFPASHVKAPTGPSVSALTLSDIFIKFAYVLRAIGPLHLAILIVALVILPFTLVPTAVLVSHLATPVLLVVSPHAVIRSNAACVCDGSVADDHVILEETFVDGAVRLPEFTFALSSIGLPIAVVR